MIYEAKKFEETPEELVARKKEEIYKRWSQAEMSEAELERVEEFINEYLKEENIPGTATEIVNDVKSIFGKYGIKLSCIAEAVQVYLFELLEF